MVDIIHKKCIYDGCDKGPAFNYKNEKVRLYCSTHKLDDMVDIIHKKCIYGGCDTRPNFNYKNEKKPLYCCTHKLDDMVDIKSKRCIYDGCDKQPSYNYKNEKKALYCSIHKLEYMIDIINKKCVLCDFNYANKNYKYHCYNCYSYKFPMDVRVKNHKTKENAFMSELKKDYPDMVLDKTISDGCSKRRPDGFLECYTHVIIVEIDENQHQNYSCENKRLMELSLDVDHRPILFIRLNPDAYTNKNGKRVKGCFTKDSNTGLLKTNKKEFDLRLDLLKDYLNDNYNKVLTKTIDIIQLYFNDES